MSDLTANRAIRPAIRFGVIGAGWFASRRHCPDVIDHDDATLVALCRRDARELDKVARAFDVEHTYTDVSELISSGLVDAVIVCSPHHLHYQHATAALEAGLHVLLEKPITIDPAQGHRLVEMAREKSLVLSVAQNPPYWNHCHFLRERIAAGALGEIEAVSINWLGNALGVLGVEDLPQRMPGVVKPTLFRSNLHENGGGFLIDGGSHLLCELLWCTRLRIESVSAQMDDAEFDLRAALTLSLSNGAMATLSQSADSQVRDKRHRSLYFGSAATAEVTGVPFEVQLRSAGAAGKPTSVEPVHEQDLPPAPTPVGDFVDCVRGDREAPLLDNDLAVHIVEVVAAAYESARSGQRVLC